MKSAHDILMWLDGLFGPRKHTDSGWQRTPPAQETGGYRLPDIIHGIAGVAAWIAPTGTRPAAYMQEYAPPVLAPLSEQSLSVSDRVAISNAFGVTEEDCEPDLIDEDDTDATKASALLKLRFCEHKKESE